jgi:Mg-chelatase subunit ChlD
MNTFHSNIVEDTYYSSDVLNLHTDDEIIVVPEEREEPFLRKRIKFAAFDSALALAAAAPIVADVKEKEKEEEEQQEQVLFLGYSLTQQEEETAFTVEGDKKDQDQEGVKLLQTKKTFGVLQLDVNVFQQLRRKLELIVNQDISGSMSDRCRDGRSKMEHTRFTLERIFDYMVQNGIDVSVGLYAFDNVIEERIPLQVLDSSNVERLTIELNRLKPRNGTNIGKALDQEKVPPKSPQADRLFILLTDGQANDGVTDKVSLKRKVDKILAEEDTTVVTVGCGIDHDSKLLDFINPGNYYFVDDFEKSGLVCGEFLDKQLNTLLKKVVITVENGEIFSWRENEWVTSLSVANIVAECNRTYHVRASNPAEFVVRITAISTKDNSPFVCEVDEKEFEQDLTKFQFRQETLEVLGEVRLYNESVGQEFRNGANAKRIKKNLLDLFKRMKDHMDKNNLRESECEDGKFMRVLCDDVVVAHRTFGSLALSAMYINARQTSQGEQRTYNVSSSQSQDAPPPPPPMSRQVQFQDDDEDDLSLLPLRPVSMSRQYTIAMKQMEQEEDDDDDDDDANDLQLCSMAAPRLKRSNNYFVPAPDLDFIPPSSVQYCSMTRRAEEDEAEEDILSQHKLGDCMTSPYSNLRQVTMMRGCSYQPPADNKDEKEEEEEDKIFPK